MQTFGSTTALTTQASIVVSTLSAGSYAIQASFSGDNVYAPSTSSTLNQVLTPPSVDMTPTINEVVNGRSVLYPPLAFPKSSKVNNNRCLRIHKAGRRVTGWSCRATRPTHPASAFFPESKVFPESKAETPGAVPKLGC